MHVLESGIWIVSGENVVALSSALVCSPLRYQSEDLISERERDNMSNEFKWRNCSSFGLLLTNASAISDHSFFWLPQITPSSVSTAAQYHYIHTCVCESRGGKGVSGRVPKAVGGLVIIGFYWILLDWPLADFKFTMHKPCSSLDWLPHQSVTSESPPWTPPPPPPQMPLFAQFHLRCSHCFSQTPNTSICFNDAIPDNRLSVVQRWNV